MPQIPVIQQQTRASGAGLGPGPMGGVGLNAIGESLQDLSRVNVAMELRHIEKTERDAAAEANAELMGARTHWMEQYRERQQSAAPGASGFTPQILKDFDADKAERLKRAKTPQAKQYLESRLNEVRLSLSDDAARFEAGAGIKYREGLLIEGVDHAKTAAEFRPAEFDQLLDEQSVAIAAAGGTPQRQAELKEIAKSQLAEAAVMGLIRQNPAATLKQLDDEKSKISSINALSFEDRTRLRNAAESEMRRVESEARARASEAQSSLRADEADAFAAKASQLPAALPSKAQYLAAYGKEGAERYAKASQRFQVFDVVGAAVAMPPAQAAQELERFAPKQQQGAADQEDTFRMAVQLYAQQRKAFEADPAGTSIERDPELGRLLQSAMSEDAAPADVETYVSRTMGLQQAAGIAAPELLPKGVADQVANSLAVNPEKPQQRIATLAALEQSWGKYMPAVMRQVAPKLDGISRVLVNMPAEQAIRLDQAYAQKEQLGKSLPSSVKSDIRAGVEDQISQFALSMADNLDAEARVGEHVEAAELLAQSYALRGMSPNDAARTATDQVINSQYEFRQQGGGSPPLRIPVDFVADSVMGGAGSLRSKVAASGELRIDPAQRSSPADAQKDMEHNIKRYGYWITNEDGTGAILRIPHRSGMGEVYRKDGSRVEYSWQELQMARPVADVVSASNYGANPSGH